METTAHIALSRQMALRRQMDLIAHNIANMTGTGFKAAALMFEPVLSDAGPGRRLAFVPHVGVARDLRAGPITSTGNPLDLAIDGPGYFAIDAGQGARYGRSGQVRLSASGELVTAVGDSVLDDGGTPLALPLDGGPTAVATDGTVSSAQGVIGRIGLFEFADEQRLQKRAAASTEPISRRSQPSTAACSRAWSRARTCSRSSR